MIVTHLLNKRLTTEYLPFRDESGNKRLQRVRAFHIFADAPNLPDITPDDDTYTVDIRSDLQKSDMRIASIRAALFMTNGGVIDTTCHTYDAMPPYNAISYTQCKHNSGMLVTSAGSYAYLPDRAVTTTHLDSDGFINLVFGFPLAATLPMPFLRLTLYDSLLPYESLPLYDPSVASRFIVA